MACSDYDWPRFRNTLLAFDSNAGIEPVKRNSGEPAKQTVDHTLSCSRQRLGTFHRRTSDSDIPTATVITAARYAMPVPNDGSNPSTVHPQINGPTIAAAREDKTIRLKNRAASISGIRVSNNGRSAVATPPKINPIAAPTSQNENVFGTAIIAMSRMTQLVMTKTTLFLGPMRSTSFPMK